MIKLMVLYGPPEDPTAFEEYYLGTHTPLAEKIPGLRKLEFSRTATLDGAASPYHLIAELTFDDAGALQAAFASDEGKAAAADVANFATGGATMLVAEVLRER